MIAGPAHPFPTLKAGYAPDGIDMKAERYALGLVVIGGSKLTLVLQHGNRAVQDLL